MDGACILLGVTLLAHAGDNRCSSRSLTDAELERVTAGSTQPKASEREGRGGIIVLNGSSATVVTNSTVDLAPLVPGQVRALNLVNASTSIVANGLNVRADQGGRLFGGTFPPANQLSLVSQDHRRFTYIDQWSPGGLYATQSSHHSFSSSHSSSSFFSANTIDQSLLIRRRTINTSSSVPSLFQSPLPRVPFGSIDFGGFTIPEFGFMLGGFTDKPKTGVKISASAGPTDIKFGAFNLGSLDFSGPDLTLGGPSLTLPGVSSRAKGSAEECLLSGCATQSFDIGFSFGGNKLSAPDVSLGPNPLRDLRFQVGSGVAGAGSGTITADAGSIGGSVGVGLGLTVSLPSIPELSIPLPFGKKIHIFGPFSIPPITLDKTVEVPFNIPTSPGLGGFTLSFQNAVFCLGADIQCPKGTATFEEHSEKVKKTTITQSSSSQWTEQSSYQASQQIVLPPVLTGARGEFFALGGGSLSATDSTSVKLSGPVHQGVRAVNLLTVSGTTLANVANIGTTGLLTSGLALAQLNTVSQRH